MYYHVRDEKRPGDSRWTFAKRCFATWGSRDEPHREGSSVSGDVYANRSPGHGWGFMARLDGPSAGTPIDVGVFFGRWFYLFASTNRGRRLNRFLRVTGETKENGWQGGSRQFEFRVFCGEGRRRPENFLVQWHLWSDPDHAVFCRGDRDRMLERHSRTSVALYETFRRGYVHPLGWVFDKTLGKTRCDVVKGDPVEVTAYLPEGSYPLTAHLETRTWKRPRSPRSTIRTEADYRVHSSAEGGPGFCPTGQEKWGSDDGLVGSGTRELSAFEAATPDKWVPIAVASFIETVLKDRARYRYLGWAPGAHRAGAAASSDL